MRRTARCPTLAKTPLRSSLKPCDMTRAQAISEDHPNGHNNRRHGDRTRCRGAPGQGVDRLFVESGTVMLTSLPAISSSNAATTRTRSWIESRGHRYGPSPFSARNPSASFSFGSGRPVTEDRPIMRGPCRNS